MNKELIERLRALADCLEYDPFPFDLDHEQRLIYQGHQRTALEAASALSTAEERIEELERENAGLNQQAYILMSTHDEEYRRYEARLSLADTMAEAGEQARQRMLFSCEQFHRYHRTSPSEPLEWRGCERENCTENRKSYDEFVAALAAYRASEEK